MKILSLRETGKNGHIISTIEIHQQELLQRKSQFMNFRIGGLILVTFSLMFVLISMISLCGAVYFWTENIYGTTTESSDLFTGISTENINFPTTKSSDSFTSSSTENTHFPSKNATAEELLNHMVSAQNGIVERNILNCTKCRPPRPCGGSGVLNPKGHNVTLLLLNIDNKIDGQQENFTKWNGTVSVFVGLHNEELGFQQAAVIALKKYFLRDDKLEEISRYWDSEWHKGKTNFICAPPKNVF